MKNQIVAGSKLADQKFQNEVFTYLDNVQKTGVINMFGAAPYVADSFGLSLPDARLMLNEWMRTYEARHQVAANV